ncbi:MAG: phage integrase SAM-like domain-containing protein [Ignavibacteriae bacterium]|nr:phage integrase SAM-like domain-containing protein [Ignavibacteriota bacterium]
MSSVYLRTIVGLKSETIYLRFKPGRGQDYEASTKIKIPKGKWSSSQQRINQNDKVDYNYLNGKLRDLKIYVSKQYDYDNLEGVIIDNNWLRNTIMTFFNQTNINDDIDSKIYLLPFLEAFIKEEQKRVASGEVNIRNVEYFNSLKNKLEEFQNYIKKNIKLTDLTVVFNQRFVSYLSDIHLLAPNTIGRYVKYIKQLCRNAEMNGHDVSHDYKSRLFKAPSNETHDIYLNEDEINKIFKYDFDNIKLDNARDWLIISVWTGLRISDFMRLDSSFINKKGMIEITTIKTKTPLLISINPYIQKILEKRNGEFPNKIPHQKYNDYIKDVCEKAGINQEVNGTKKILVKTIKENGKEKKIHRKRYGKYPKYDLVSSHVGRRSFATNMYGSFPTLSIMKITGHSTEKQFLSYIKRTSSEYAEQLDEYWKNKEYDNSLEF